MSSYLAWATSLVSGGGPDICASITGGEAASGTALRGGWVLLGGVKKDDGKTEVSVLRFVGSAGSAELNAARMNSSLARLQMPTFDGDAFVECLKALVRADAAWVPTGEGHAAYLRPTAIATDPFLGVGVPQASRLFCILSPVGPYFKDGFAPIAVLADADNVRAWPGGAGNTKVGGNYARAGVSPARFASF